MALLLTLFGLAGVFVLFVMGVGYALSAPAYRGPVSDHFDGIRFHNEAHTGHGKLSDVVRWSATRKPGPWRELAPSPPGPKPPERVGPGGLRATWVGHSTVLIQMDGLNILTDPVWSLRASPFPFGGPKRVRAPGIRFEDLPRIDLVLLSHNHYDHLDPRTLERLSTEHHARFVVPLGNRAYLETRRVKGAEELDWWQSLTIGDGLRLTGLPAQHFSARGLYDRDKTLWMGYVIAAPGGSVYYAGDTGFGPHFAELHARCGPMRLAILPIGAFRPEWFMARVHVAPEQALEAHRIVEARTSLAIHFGTFRLADDGQDEAPERLRAAIAASITPTAPFWIPESGEGRDIQ